MHAIASYITSVILSPLNWIIILLVAAYFFNKKSIKKACKILALCIFLLFSNQLLLDWYANTWQPKPLNVKQGTVYSCGIVLGGFAGPDASGNGYFNASADRFIQALKLYKLGEIKNILISGGNGKDQDKNFREGAWVKTQLQIMGVPDSAIFVEDVSNNTFDNALHTKQMLDSLKLDPPYPLITSAFHEPRARLLFRNAGVSTIAYPSNYTEGTGKFTFSSLLPQLSVLMGWDSYLKEAVGFMFYKFRGK